MGWEVLSGLGLSFTNSGGTWGKWDMCLCFGCGVVGVCGGGPLGPGSGMVGWCYVSVCCDSGCFVLMACPSICIYCAGNLRCTQCLIMLHHIDICFLTCIYLWQIS